MARRERARTVLAYFSILVLIATVSMSPLAQLARASHGIWLGTDRTYTTANWGEATHWVEYGCSRWEESDYILSERRARVVAYPFLSGYCKVHAVAKVGFQFPIYGTGSQTANIRASGHIKGLTSAVGSASASSHVTFEVKDLTTGTVYSTSIKDVTCGGPYCDTVTDEDYNVGITLLLVAGRTYVAYIHIHGIGWLFAIFPFTGQARSDWGPWPTNAIGESIWYNSITVDF